MNPIVASEYDKLSDWQKSKFHELVGWQLKGHKGTGASDFTHAKIIEWVKRMDEPPPPPAEPEEPTQE